MTEKKNENEMVMAEFKLLDDDSNVYKLVGPILAKQDLTEAKENVQNRLTHIEKSIAEFEAQEKDFAKQVTEKSVSLKGKQAELQKFAMAMQ